METERWIVFRSYNGLEFKPSIYGAGSKKEAVDQYMNNIVSHNRALIRDVNTIMDKVKLNIKSIAETKALFKTLEDEKCGQ